jgi:hypothetical protein
MDQKSKHNPRRKFDAVQEQALGIYVYVLWDPRDSKAFYVGMGAGSRVFDHFNEVENLGSELWKSKHRRIADIWAEDLEVRWSIIRRNLGDENCAADVEAAVIDALEISQNGITLNEVRGQGVRLHGSLSEEEVAALAAIPVDPEYNYNAVFLFPIQSTLAQGRSVYDATRIAWPISNEYRTLANGMAVGIAGGIRVRTHNDSQEGRIVIHSLRQEAADDSRRFLVDEEAICTAQAVAAKRHPRQAAGR